MFIFGGGDSIIGSFHIPGTKCDYCSQENTQVITIFGKYAHIFWIPIFPYGKDAMAECTHCKRTMEEKEFSPKLKIEYQKYKAIAEHPFYHWSGLAISGFLILLVFIIGFAT
jgi:zinc-ribbon family